MVSLVLLSNNSSKLYWLFLLQASIILLLRLLWIIRCLFWKTMFLGFSVMISYAFRVLSYYRLFSVDFQGVGIWFCFALYGSHNQGFFFLYCLSLPLVCWFLLVQTHYPCTPMRSLQFWSMPAFQMLQVFFRSPLSMSIITSKDSDFDD